MSRFGEMVDQINADQKRMALERELAEHGQQILLSKLMRMSGIMRRLITEDDATITEQELEEAEEAIVMATAVEALGTGFFVEIGRNG